MTTHINRRLRVNWHYWGLTLWTGRVGREVFALRCLNCCCFTLGCREHWFCGLCEPCRKTIEE